jgi:hypothetical protein
VVIVQICRNALNATRYNDRVRQLPRLVIEDSAHQGGDLVTRRLGEAGHFSFSSPRYALSRNPLAPKVALDGIDCLF